MVSLRARWYFVAVANLWGEAFMRMVSLAAIAAVFAFVSFSSQAMPVSQLKGVTKASGQITQVAGGCGRGWHRGPHGHCRHN